MSFLSLPDVGPTPVQLPPPGAVSSDARLMDAARALEASFISEMLKSAGVDMVPSAFGGGIGEEQFSSFLRDAHAREMVRAGGIGLAESLFDAMKERQDG